MLVLCSTAIVMCHAADKHNATTGAVLSRQTGICCIADREILTPYTESHAECWHQPLSNGKMMSVSTLHNCNVMYMRAAPCGREAVISNVQ